jgi:hypothetical protein
MGIVAIHHLISGIEGAKSCLTPQVPITENPNDLVHFTYLYNYYMLINKYYNSLFKFLSNRGADFDPAVRSARIGGMIAKKCLLK